MKLRQIGKVKIARGRVVLNQPIVTEGTVFTGYPMTVTVGLDKNSLEPIWRKKVGVTFKGVSAGVLAVWTGIEFQGWDTGGKVLWKRSFGVDPFVHGRHLLFLESGTLHVVDGATGRTLEEFACPDGWPALLHDDVLLIQHPEQDGPSRAFHYIDRRVMWERNLKRELSGRGEASTRDVLSVVPAGPGRLVGAMGSQIFGISLSDGECRWNAPVHLPYYEPQVSNGRIYAWTTARLADPTIRTTLDVDSMVMIRERPGDAGAENRFVILEEATGKTLVDRPLVQYGREFAGRLEPRRGAFCRNHIAFGTDAGLLVLFRLSDGEPAWTEQLHDSVWTPVVDGNRLYVDCADGTLVVFEGEGGEL